MKINQISVFLENKEGRIYEVCELLGAHDINIDALNIAESEGFGVLRMIVNKPKAAMAALKEKGFSANQTDILAVEVEDRPGGLADVLRVISTNQLNVEYMYGFTLRKSDRALMVFRFDDPEKAAKTLQANQIRIIRGSDIQES
ncbi:MAG: ACT domain-containing protein [Phycisphaerae bacterium]|jgi:hypothetical protein|nr:ACT domain-containing protein [Phycisphaerae bacterium]